MFCCFRRDIPWTPKQHKRLMMVKHPLRPAVILFKFVDNNGVNIGLFTQACNMRQLTLFIFARIQDDLLVEIICMLCQEMQECVENRRWRTVLTNGDTKRNCVRLP